MRNGEKPLVLLIGDSIRMGYAPFVKNKQQDMAIVKWPDENCEDSSKVLANIKSYIEAYNPDLIYINCGLHDIKSERGTGHPKTPVELYENNLARIMAIIQDKGIKILWASTTPVIDEWHNKIQDFDRFDKDVVAYNKSAARVMHSFGINTVDHYQTISDADAVTVYQKDGVHYKEAGSKMLSEIVSREIAKALKLQN